MAGIMHGVTEAPIHPGYPLNTAWDDFSLSTADGGLSGWFISTRPGGKGSDDIYLFLKRVQGTGGFFALQSTSRTGEQRL